MARVFTIEDIKNSAVAEINQHLFCHPIVKKKKKSKFGNSKTEVDGIVFDSEREANYYKQLLILLKAGKIAFLERQVPFELNEGGSHSLKYIADFVWIESENGEKVVCDVKGFKTREYLKKKRLMKKIYGIKIKEA